MKLLKMREEFKRHSNPDWDLLPKWGKAELYIPDPSNPPFPEKGEKKQTHVGDLFPT